MRAAGAGTGEPAGSEVRARFERIYHTLRTRICLLDHAPGERLREEDIAEEFNTSRTPVRRVLARLEDEGLLRSVHGVGTIVTDIHIDDLQQVYQLRVELAELIGRISPVRPDRAEMEEYHRQLARCAVLIEKPDAREFARLNMEFFHLLMRLTANEPLRAISERLYYQTTRIWLQTASKLQAYEDMLVNEIRVFQREMADIVAAIECGDLHVVGHIRRAHVAMSFARLHAAAHPGQAADG
ncbi:GntR family transcriptional regulator [Chelativorans sp. AA-79]|uniref:GntR family transcriptional regulator n=1 Tax=Chelativorans sp. AA-79 TaxID=3028735 RepID=UPI0023F66649|nr:GntR family transcriptional regulator [Chelativorans sp. AA-79]WEX10517.1 GntR family transcriptional regulator [Chelativorans sp. AA-79]